MKIKSTKQQLGPFKDDGLHHYYLRDDDHNPVGCVVIGMTCVEADNNQENQPRPRMAVCRGVSLLSTDDQWSRVRARKLAKGRMMKAAAIHESSEPIRAFRTAADTPDSVNWWWSKSGMGHKGTTFKSGFDVVPTELESKILLNAERKAGLAECSS